jgi:hypothetical protein
MPGRVGDVELPGRGQVECAGQTAAHDVLRGHAGLRHLGDALRGLGGAVLRVRARLDRRGPEIVERAGRGARGGLHRRHGLLELHRLRDDADQRARRREPEQLRATPGQVETLGGLAGVDLGRLAEPLVAAAAFVIPETY